MAVIALDHVYFSNTVHQSLLIQVSSETTELVIMEEQFLPSLAQESQSIVRYSATILSYTKLGELFLVERTQM